MDYRAGIILITFIMYKVVNKYLGCTFFEGTGKFRCILNSDVPQKQLKAIYELDPKLVTFIYEPKAKKEKAKTGE